MSVHARVLSAAIMAAAVAVTQAASADEPTGAAIQYDPEEFPEASAQTSVILAGAGVTLGFYGVGFGTSYLWPDAPTASDLRIPVAGPVLALAGAKCGSNEPGCDTVTVVARSIFAIISGLGQVGGLLIVGEGLFMPTAASSPVRGAALSSQPSFYAAPSVTDTGFGLSFGGQF